MNETMRVIDGAGVPESIYRAVKTRAVETGVTQFIGFFYARPAALKVDIFADDTDTVILRNAQARYQQRNGENCAYILGFTREELKAHFEYKLSVILWVTPVPDAPIPDEDSLQAAGVGAETGRA